MKRKDYQAPAMRVVNLQHRSQLLQASVNREVRGMSSNADMEYGGSDDTYSGYGTYGAR